MRVSSYPNPDIVIKPSRLLRKIARKPRSMRVAAPAPYVSISA